MHVTDDCTTALPVPDMSRCVLLRIEGHQEGAPSWINSKTRSQSIACMQLHAEREGGRGDSGIRNRQSEFGLASKELPPCLASLPISLPEVQTSVPISSP